MMHPERLISMQLDLFSESSARGQYRPYKGDFLWNAMAEILSEGFDGKVHKIIVEHQSLCLTKQTIAGTV